MRIKIIGEAGFCRDGGSNSFVAKAAPFMGLFLYINSINGVFATLFLPVGMGPSSMW